MMNSLNSYEHERYSRHLLISGFDSKHQMLMKQAKVLIIGLGGLGGPVAINLNAAGVGTLGLLDNDVVSVSNLQRQILFTEASLDKSKAESASQTLHQRNSATKLDIFNIRLVKENALDIIKDYDIIVDCTDNFEARYLINDACQTLDKPWVHGSIYEFTGQVSVFNYRGGPSYRCLYPKQASTSKSPIGVVGALPSVTGSIQALEVIKLIAGLGSPLSGKMLMFDALNNMYTTLNIKADPDQISGTYNMFSE